VRIENEFLVKAPVETVWAYMLDVERIAPCAPGAELTEVVDERTWKGKLKVKVGPIAMSFAGTVVLEERDDQLHRAVLKAQGREERGRGAATATVTTRLEPADASTRVQLDTDLTISGAAAQYGRGMIGDISQRLADDFAKCVEAGILSSGSAAAADAPGGSERVASPPATQVAAQPVKGLRLGVWAFWRAVVRFFKRLIGGRSRP
jgi:carbon monoxide dehydrogenase subunit G